MRKLKITGIALLIFFGGLIAALYIYFLPGSIPADNGTPLLIYNGRIITMDEAAGPAEAVITGNGRIRFAGSLKSATELISPDTIKLDLKGKTLIPGFNDNHTHSFYGAAFFSELVLWKKSCSEIVELVKSEAARLGPGETITGNSWDYTDCPAPHRSMLDAAAPNNPVYLTQYSGHADWVNSAMLKKLRIDRNTPDPPGGQIVRDAKGEPTGILRDTAMGSSAYEQFVGYLMSPTKHRMLIEKALNIYRRAGITTAQDNTWEPFTVRLLNRLAAEGALTCRFTCWSQGDSFMEAPFNLFAFFHKSGLLVHRGPIKYFSDGAFSTRTAWLFEEYADEPGNTGSPRYSESEMEDIVMAAARNKRQIAVHAIGDRAVNQVLNAIEKARRSIPGRKTFASA